MLRINGSKILQLRQSPLVQSEKRNTWRLSAIVPKFGHLKAFNFYYRG